MLKVGWAISVMGGAILVSGCATRHVEQPLDELPPPAAGEGQGEIIVDNEDPTFFVDGPWVESRSSGGYIGNNYHVIGRGTGENSAIWNLETIKLYDIYARWTSHSNRASNAEYLIHYIDDNGTSAIDVVQANQRTNGGQWVKLGTYRMSSLTSRVELTDAGNGYVVADAIRFVLVEDSVAFDTDGDGMSDSFENQYGLNMNDPEDALGDLDGDELTNIEEFNIGSDPTAWDTDSDGISDGYEVSYGLDPASDDASLDADGDGYSNIEEYDSGTAANDAESVPGQGPLISWSAPTQRLDGSPLNSGDIDYYEVQYEPASKIAGITVDDSSGYFEIVGANIEPSSHTQGFLGVGYHPIPPSEGDVYARWNFFELQPGIPYQVESRWVSAWNRSNRAQYRVVFVSEGRAKVLKAQIVDQTSNGGQWNQVAEFTPADSSASVELVSDTSGYVIADAVRLTPGAAASGQVVSVPGDQPRLRLEQSPGRGEWIFRVRAVDNQGVASEYSEPLSVSFP